MTSEADELADWLDHLVSEAGRHTSAFEARAESSASLAAVWDQDGMRALNESRLTGLALRVWVDGAAGFASCHDPSRAAVAEVVAEAVAIARANARKAAATFPYAPASAGSVAHAVDVAGDPLDSDPDALASLLERAHEGAMAHHPDGYARSALGTTRRRVLFENGEGRRADTGFLLSTLQAQAVHRGGPRLAEHTAWVAGERGLDDFEDDGGPEAIGRLAAERAEEASRAKAVPAGRQRVLCDNMLSGLLAHESFGHLTEYDLVHMEWSLLNGHRGERFAGDHVSVVDSPTVPGAPRKGVRLPHDDEGTRGRAVRVLDGGVLTHWMHQRGSATLADDQPTGNARAKDARHPPIVRMRNTYFEPGDWSLEEALEALGDGVYLCEGRGGAPASDGSFTFTAVRGYLVEGGEPVAPLRSTTISGNIFDFLSGVEAVTRDFEVITSSFGGCGKWGQTSLPVGVGGPHVLVNEALVGGSAT